MLLPPNNLYTPRPVASHLKSHIVFNEIKEEPGVRPESSPLVPADTLLAEEPTASGVTDFCSCAFLEALEEAWRAWVRAELPLPSGHVNPSSREKIRTGDGGH